MTILSRRSCLKTLAALTAFSPFPGWASGGRGLKVIVVGAGVAGLAAAETLIRRGAEVTVL